MLLVLLLSCFSAAPEVGREAQGAVLSESLDGDSVHTVLYGKSGGESEVGAGLASDVKAGGDGLPKNPIIVHWTLDTLTMFAANEVGVCEDLQGLFAAYGRTLDCRGGGVSPSSWTIESTVRMLWPKHYSPRGSSELNPNCEDASVAVRMAHVLGARSTIGFDNAMLDRLFAERGVYCDGTPSWLLGFDTAYVNSSEFSLAELALMDDDERSLEKSMRDLFMWARTGESVVAVFNDFEAGGHTPRCPGEPTETCNRLWNMARGEGFAEHGELYTVAMLDPDYWGNIHRMLEDTSLMDDAEVQDVTADTIVETASYYWHVRSFPRFQRLAHELDRMGRLDDLVLVVVSDHGERPCHRSVHTLQRTCGHGGRPDSWTTSVPTYIMPASLSEDWEERGLIGDEDRAWSTVNLSHGLYEDFAGDTPGLWGEPEPVGTATSWSCWGTSLTPRTPMGLRVDGAHALQCAGECSAQAWSVPNDRDYEEAGITLTGLPMSIGDWLYPDGPTGTDRFVRLCDMTE